MILKFEYDPSDIQKKFKFIWNKKYSSLYIHQHMNIEQTEGKNLKKHYFK